MGQSIQALLLAASLAFTTAVPIGSRNTCATTCSTTETTKFSYDRDTNYIYDYEASSHMEGHMTPVDVKVKGKATVGNISPCEFVLTLDDFNLENSEHSQDFASKVQQFPLRFAYDDGKIEKVCAAEGEEEWVLNFKRAVLSNFQNTMQSITFDETVKEIGVTGECETKYQNIQNTPDTKMIIKETDSSCNKVPFGSQTTLPKQLQNIPLLNSQMHCEQTITAGVLAKSVCNDVVNVKLAGGNQGFTGFETSLVLSSQTTGVNAATHNLRETSLEFKNEAAIEEDPLNFTKIEALLTALETKSTPIMDKEVPAMFSELVERMKHLNTRQINLLFTSFKATNSFKFLIDALPMASTPSSTEVMATMIANGDVSTKDSEMWFASLSYVQNPEVEMFEPLKTLISQTSSKNAILGAANMLKKYFDAHHSEIQDSRAVMLIDALEQKLGSGCRSTTSEEKDVILLVLKGLKTIGYLSKPDVIDTCFSETSNPMDVRVAALEVYHNANCFLSRNNVMSIYSNARLDAELRINAYLGMMSCPTLENIEMIKEKLRSESANQVGTFVWTHLTNLQESASQEKQWIRPLIGEEALMKKFNSTSPHLSRNTESSFYSESLGLGSTVESNLIFGSQSFLPRSGMFNLTFDLFGQPINLIEMGARFEGFEIFAERFFGPHGYYPDETVEGILKSLKRGREEDETTFERLWGTEQHEPEGSYYMRMFGTDMLYHHFHGLENIFEEKETFNFDTFMTDLVRNGRNEYTKNFKLMDTELVYPTIIGFPLSLKLNGTANIGFKVDGDFAFRSLSDIDIRGHMYPSAAFEIDAAMMINTHFAKSGMKYVMNGESSLMIDGDIKVQNAQMVDVTFRMPQENRVTLVNIEKKMVALEHGKEITQIEDSYDDSSREECTSLIGTKVCMSKSVNHFRMVSEKIDTHNSYKLRYLREPNSISFLLDMPGSMTDRKLSLTALKSARDEYKLDLHTPWKTVKSTALVVLAGNEPKIDVEVTIDNRATFQGGVELRKQQIGAVSRYEPSIYFMHAGRHLIDSSGRIEINSDTKKVEVSLQSTGFISGSFLYARAPVDGETRIEASYHSSFLDFNTKLMHNYLTNMHTQFELEYTLMRQNPQNIKIETKFELIEAGTMPKRTADVHIVSSMMPNQDIRFTGDIMGSNTEGSLNWRLVVGNYLTSENSATVTMTSGLKEVTVRGTYAMEHLHLNGEYSEKVRVQGHHYLIEAMHKIGGVETKNKLEMKFAEERGFINVEGSKTGDGRTDFNTVMETSYTKIAPRHYTARASMNSNLVYPVQFTWDGSVHDRSVYGQLIDTEVATKLALNGATQEATLITKISDTEVIINGNAKIHGIAKHIKFSVRPRSLEFETNVASSLIAFNADLMMQGSSKTAEFRGRWGEKTLESRLQIVNNNFFEAEFKFDNIAKRMTVELLSRPQTGVKFAVELSPSQVIEGEVKYTHGPTSSFNIWFTTPFGAYTKQELLLTLNKPAPAEFTSSLQLTWKNARIVDINVNGNVNSGLYLTTSAVVDQTIFGFNQGSFKINHNKVGLNLDDSIEAMLDGQKMVEGTVRTVIQAHHSTVDVQLKTAMTDPITLAINVKPTEMGSAKFTYGPRTVEADYKLTMTSNQRAAEINFNLNALEVPAVMVQLKLDSTASLTTFNSETTVNGHKYILSLEKSTSVSGQQRTHIMSATVTFPDMPVLTAQLKLIMGSGNYEMHMEVPDFIGGRGTAIFHASLGNLSSPDPDVLVMTLNTEDVNVELRLTLEHTPDIFMTELKASLNRQHELYFKTKVESIKTNPNEIVLVEFNKGQGLYKFVAGGEWAEESKKITLLLEKDITRMFALNIELIGDVMSFEWVSPSMGRANVSYTRNRRAVPSRVFSNFNSLRVTLTSPNPASFVMERTAAGGFQVDYQRLDNSLHFSANPGQNRSFNIEMRSALPGWKFLALTGRLNQEQMQGYLEGQINEAKTTIQGQGYYGRTKTDLTFTMTSPYQGFETVTAKFAFDKRQRTFNLSITTAPNSQFRFILKEENGPLVVDIHVPHPQEPTIVNGNISPFSGSLMASSRHAFLRNFEMNYSLQLPMQMPGSRTELRSSIKYHNLEVFSLAINSAARYTNVDMNFRRTGHHSRIHIERTGVSSASFTFTRDGKEFKIQLTNEGSFPTAGTINFNINNSFRQVPRTITGSVQYDRSGSERTANVQMTLPGNMNVRADVTYSLDLSRGWLRSSGNYVAHITMPNGVRQTASETWNFADPNNISWTADFPMMKLDMNGKVGLQETNVNARVTLGAGPEKNIHIEWRMLHRDYYVKIGSSERFVMFQLTPTRTSPHSGDVVFAFQARRFMAHPVEINFNWNRDATNGITASGTWSYNIHTGSFNLSKLKRVAATRSAEIVFEASNVPQINSLSIRGDYSFHNAAVVNLDVSVGGQKMVGLHFDVSDITSLHTQQTAQLTLPGMGEVNINFGHDFRNPRKTYTITANVNGVERYLRAAWERSPDFRRLSGNLEINSGFIGMVDCTFGYDFTNMSNATANVNYTRGTKFFNLNFERKFSATELRTKFTFTSSNAAISNVSMDVHATFNPLNLSVELQRNNRRITFNLNFTASSINARLTTPYRGFEEVTATISYTMSPGSTSVDINYVRGSRRLNASARVNMMGPGNGSFTVTASTPFNFLRDLRIEGTFQNGTASITYTRNGVTHRFSGQFAVAADRRNVELSFTPPGGQPMRIAFGYTFTPGNQAEILGTVEFEMFGHMLELEARGNKSPERFMMEITAESSFPQLRQLEVSLDSELSLQEREGSMKIVFNEFHFNIQNTMEQRMNGGYYWRSEIESSLTTLPGIVFGFGKDAHQAYIITFGVAEEREITLTLAPKAGFRNGFSGSVTIPHMGIENLRYDFNYKFANPNQLDMDFNIALPSGVPIIGSAIYNSNGVQARLSSPWGNHRARARRSVNANGFFGELGLNDYSVSLRGDRIMADTKKGFKIEGEVMGRRVSVDALVQLQGNSYGEGKFIIESNIPNFEKAGITITGSKEPEGVRIQTQLEAPSMPNLVLNLEADLTNARRARLTMNVGTEQYVLDGSYQVIDNYSAEVSIQTPHESFRNLNLKGKIMMNTFKNVDTEFEVTYDSGSARFSGKYDLLVAQPTGNIEFIWSCAGKPDCTLNAFFKTDNGFHAKADAQTMYLAHPISIELKAQDTVAEVMVSMSGEKHMISVNLENNARLTVVASSPLIGGSYRSELSKFGQKFTFNVACAARKFEISLDLNSGIHGLISYISDRGHDMIELKTTSTRNEISGSLVARVDQFEHKLEGTLNHNPDSMNVKITSPYLLHDIILNASLENGSIRSMIKASVVYGPIVHSVATGYAYEGSSASFILEVETPVFNLNKLTLKANLQMSSDINADAVLEILGQTHSFELRSNMVSSSNQGITLTVKSPRIPGQILRIEGDVSGMYPQSFTVTGLVQFNNQSFSSKLNMDIRSLSNVYGALEVKTPFEGYRKMNFILNFQQTISNIVMNLTAESPLNMKVEVQIGEIDRIYKTVVHVETPFAGYERIMVTAEIPMHETATKVTIQLPNSTYGFDFRFADEQYSKMALLKFLNNGTPYGGGLKLRYKAPYVMDADVLDKRFHVRMDSSVFNAIYSYYFL